MDKKLLQLNAYNYNLHRQYLIRRRRRLLSLIRKNSVQSSVDHFENEKIAVVGVSANPEKYGHKIFRDLVGSGLDVTGVNQKAEPILEHKIYASIKDLPESPDMVITVVQPVVTESIVKQCHDLGINKIWMQPGSESTEAITLAKEYGMNVTSGLCFMKATGIW